MTRLKCVLHWSGGKDALLALDYLQQHPRYEVVSLLTTSVNGYVDMHGVPMKLLYQQSKQLNIPLIEVALTYPAREYEQRMLECYQKLKKEGIKWMAFGDIHLETLRKYRSMLVEKAGLVPVFPLWKSVPAQLLNRFCIRNHKALVVSVRSDLMGLLGQPLDENFAGKIGQGTDLCGERGEYHTFVYDGPLFARAVHFERGLPFERSYPDPAEKGKTVSYSFLGLRPL